MSEAAEQQAQWLRDEGWRVTANGRWRHARLRENTLGGNHRPPLLTIADAIRQQGEWDAQEQVVVAAAEEAAGMRACPDCGSFECPGAVLSPMPAA